MRERESTQAGAAILRQERDDQGIPSIPMELHPILMRSSSLASLSLCSLCECVYHPSIPSCTFYNLILSTSLCCSTSPSPEAFFALSLSVRVRYLLSLFSYRTRARLCEIIILHYKYNMAGAWKVVNPCVGMQPVQRWWKFYIASSAFAFLTVSETIIFYLCEWTFSLLCAFFNNLIANLNKQVELN